MWKITELFYHELIYTKKSSTPKKIYLKNSFKKFNIVVIAVNPHVINWLCVMRPLLAFCALLVSLFIETVFIEYHSVRSAW